VLELEKLNWFAIFARKLSQRELAKKVGTTASVICQDGASGLRMLIADVTPDRRRFEQETRALGGSA
jgi:hypothetical protein